MRLLPALAAILACAGPCPGVVQGAPESAPTPTPALAPHHHALTPAQLQELRSAVRAYARLSDAQILERMQVMPPDFAVYLSGPEVTGDTGVLLLVHGGGEVGNNRVRQALAPIAADEPTAIAFGMSMHDSVHLQAAVDQLTAAGVRTIVAVPTVSTSDYNTLNRQWAFVLGLRDKPGYATVPRVSTKAVLRMAPAFGASELIGQILLAYAREISRHPAGESVMLVGHGPDHDEDNVGDLRVLQAHARYLREHGGFAAVEAFNLQDDAPGTVRTANVSRLRQYVENQTEAGRRVLVVGFLMSTAGIQDKIQRDLQGLDYAFNTRGMSEHPLFTEWVRRSVAAALVRD